MILLQKRVERPVADGSDQDIDPDEIDMLADSIVKECRDMSPLSSLDTDLYLLRQALDHHPAPHPRRSDSVNHLSLACLLRFFWTGQISALDEARMLMEAQPTRPTFEQQSIEGRGIGGHKLQVRQLRLSPITSIANVS